MQPNIFDLGFEDLHKLIVSWKEPEYRASQIWEGLYKNLWSTPEEFSNIPLPLRNRLTQAYQFSSLSPEKRLNSNDGFTTKFLFRLSDDTAIETVIMEYSDRITICISSQVGCGMGCSFCATGNMGFSRNLSSGEIIEQVIKIAQDLDGNNKRLTNVVFMGMGEPFQNYQAVLSAIKTLNHPSGFGMGARRFTISTVGLVPGIKQFTEDNTQINLAVSLHAADDDLRSSFMPINRKYGISELMSTCDDYINKTNRRVTIEWALIDGVNDTSSQAKKLTKLVRNKLYHVNLIQLNLVKHYQGVPSAEENARSFQKILIDAGVSCTIRLRRGIDISAGCGQLASNVSN